MKYKFLKIKETILQSEQHNNYVLKSNECDLNMYILCMYYINEISKI